MDNTMVARFQVHVSGVSHRVCGYWRFVAADDDHYCGIAVEADRAIRHTCWSQSAGRTEQPFSSPSARFLARSLSFEVGLLWSRLIRYAGSVICNPFLLEGFALFTETICLGHLPVQVESCERRISSSLGNRRSGTPVASDVLVNCTDQGHQPRITGVLG